MDFRELINKIDSINSEAKKEPERLAFADAIDHVKDIKFTPPLPSGIEFSSANNTKFKGQDINDPKVKYDLFVDELKNSPARLLGEIGSRIKPSSDAQMDLSGHIAAMGDKLAQGSNRIGELSKPEQELALAAIKAALKGMELERDPDQSEYKDDEDDRMESSLPWKKFETPVNETDDKEKQLKAWYDKYSKYEGNNGDELPAGMLTAYIDTGILTDGVEGNELMKAIDKIGGDRYEAERKLFSDEQLFSKLLPITDAMQKDYMKAMGVSEIDEDNCTQAAKILGDDIVGFGVESMSEGIDPTTGKEQPKTVMGFNVRSKEDKIRDKKAQIELAKRNAPKSGLTSKDVPQLEKELASLMNEGDNIYHSCVKSFKHEKFGEGEVLHGEHTLSESGDVSHYDAKFVREDGSQFIVRNIPVANMKECVVVEHGHPKKKKKVKEEEVVDEAHYQDFKQKVISVNKDIKLAGDSIWDKQGTNPKSVNVKAIRVTYEIDTESDDPADRDETYVSVYVDHDGPWEIYTDSGFEDAISQMVGIDVEFTEQGMQDDGEASLEGSIATKDIPADAKPMETAVPAEDWFQGQTAVTLEGDSFYETFGWIGENDENIEEAEYQGRTVKLNKPMRGDVKKFKVYVKNPKGNVVKVNFGDPDMKIKKSNPARRRSFRARHNCDTPGPKHKARYWSCRKW